MTEPELNTDEPKAVSACRISAKQWLVRAAVAISIVFLPMLIVPAQANAATPCSGQVCLYDSSGTFVGAYRDVTSTWQNFSRTRTASAFNGFSDNAVYFRYSSDKTSCIQPQRQALVDHTDYGPVVALMIVSNGNCYPGGQIVP